VDLTRVIFVTTERLLGSDVDSAFDLYAAADDVAPDTSITGGPPAVTRDDTPGFRFAATESDSTFRCRLDSGAFNPCGSPKTLGHTGEGKHTFTVFAVDAAGNVDFSPASRTFTIDRHVTLRLGGRRSQHVGRRRLVAVTVRCPQERCSVRVSARGAKPVRVSLRANRAKTVRLKLRHAPRRGHSARVKVSAAARDGAGNTATKRMNVTVRR
jgi:hypothetical protein